MKCPVCNREVPEGLHTCPSCGLVLETKIDDLTHEWQPSSGQFQLGRRVGSVALDIGIFIFTLGIGWLIWQLFLLNRAQSPAKQILNLRVEQVRTNSPSSIPKYLLRLISLPIAVLSIVLVAFLGLSLTGKPVSQAWLLAFSQVVLILVTAVDFGSIFTARRSRLTDRFLRTKVAFGTNVLG